MSAPPAAPPRPPARGHEPGGPAPAAPAPADAPADGPFGDALLLPLIAVVVTASLPLTRVFVGNAFLRPVLAAALLSLGVSWVCRRLGAGPITTLVASSLAWFVFSALAFVPDTLRYGLLPTTETIVAGRDLWLRGIEIIGTRPAPAFPEAGILLLTATGVWWVAHAVDGLLYRLQAPLRALAMALVLWVVPLAMARDDATAWVWAAPLLAAAAWLLLAAGGSDLQRWGARVRGRAAATEVGAGAAGFDRSGALIATAAIAAGALLGGLLPGFGEPPYYRVQRIGGGTTLTTNPIVSIRANLVSQTPTPVARVRTPDPVYLRLTALDVFDQREQWTGEGIRGGSATGRLQFETDVPSYRELEVEVQPEGLEEAVLVPVPYQPLRLSGPAADRFLYDRGNGTVTLAAGHTLSPEDSYEVVAAIPDPEPDALVSAPVGNAQPQLTALPGNVPDDVVALAERIVADAGATNPFEQALAIQAELRSWTYSLEPPAGHGGSAMQSFIENRIGYCEQFAGTMAVMLRSLGIPARVAVGYTPGEVVDDDGERRTYLVTRANAHAWVEALFPGAGWIAFEPTPRADGNVLTPTAANLAPTRTDADRDPTEALGDLGQFDDITDLVPQLDDMALGGDRVDAAAPAPQGADGRQWPWVAAALAGLGLVAAAGAARAGRRRPASLAPAERVLTATDRVCRVGRGLGRVPTPAETDREYLLRLAGSAPGTADCLPAATTLAAAAGRARYATGIVDAEARAAEAAAARMRDTLLAAAPAWRRPLVRARGALGDGLTAARRRLRPPAPDGAAQQTPARVHRRMAQRR